MMRSEDRRQFLFDVFVTAMEGGVGYWARVRKYKWILPGKEGDYFTTDDIEDVDGFSAELIDEDNNRHTVNRGTIISGLRALHAGPVKGLNEKSRAFMLKAEREKDAGMLDAGDADNIVQIGLFNEVIYG